MATRSYLRRIAAPLNPAEPSLSPLLVPPPGEARPPAIHADPLPVLRRRSSALAVQSIAANRAGPVFAPVGPPAVLPVAARSTLDASPPGLGPSIAAVQGSAGPRSTTGRDIGLAEGDGGLREGDGPRSTHVIGALGMLAAPPAATGRAAVRSAPVPLDVSGVSAFRASPLPEPVGTPRAGVHIGTIEVRARAVAASPAPPVQTNAPAPAPVAPSQPLARGLAWRYGLVQS